MDDWQQQPLRDLAVTDIEEAVGQGGPTSVVAMLVEYLREKVGLTDLAADEAARHKLRAQYGRRHADEMWRAFTDDRAKYRRRARTRPPARHGLLAAYAERFAHLDPALPEDRRPLRPRGGVGRSVAAAAPEIEQELADRRRRAQRRAMRRSTPQR